ncbi:MAG: ABC transporter permease subunit [Erysipelothrix sp.]|nr:ABC transporter permease subunit [Erysipelothrix sp.]
MGFKNTMIVFWVTLLVSLPIASLLALIYQTKAKKTQALLSSFIWFIRGSPLMLQLIFAMFGLPVILGIPFKNRLLIATVTFIINYTAYFIATFQNGLALIAQNQWDAAQMLQIPKIKMLFKVIYPQMYRNTLRTIENETITLIKDTALISTVALNEILRASKEILNRDLRIEPLFVALAFYLGFSFLIIQCFKLLQRKARLI